MAQAFRGGGSSPRWAPCWQYLSWNWTAPGSSTAISTRWFTPASRRSADRHTSQLRLSDERATRLQDKLRLHHTPRVTGHAGGSSPQVNLRLPLYWLLLLYRKGASPMAWQNSTRHWTLNMHIGKGLRLPNHPLFFKGQVLRWGRVNFSRAWSFSERTTTPPDHQQFLLPQRPPPNQHFSSFSIRMKRDEVETVGIVGNPLAFSWTRLIFTQKPYSWF